MGRNAQRPAQARQNPTPGPGRLAPASWLHLQDPEGPPWKLLPWLLGGAFAVRAAVALAGDFVLHPDEIMQYLEPAHRLVFGNGITYWEFFYGARSWLVPGLVAGILAGFDSLGLGTPSGYVGGVKLAFCAISLLVPAGMYGFARRHFGEATARVALLAGVFWYELVGFAHKPLTEFVATALLLALLALCVRPSLERTRVVWGLAGLAVLVAAVRMQYAPLAVLLLGVVFLRTPRKKTLAIAAAACALAVGLFDGITWGGGLFHSYRSNFGFNLANNPAGAGPPGIQYLWWIGLASAGLGILSLAGALRSPRRYGFLLALVAVTLLLHALPAHKEYRFVFAVVPLWLLIGSDLVARWAARGGGMRRGAGLAGIAFAAISAAGILNALPGQERVYQASTSLAEVRFLRGQDPIFAAYRHLAEAPGVQGVIQVDRTYYDSPGYYYLHRKVPFYDAVVGEDIIREMSRASAFVSHVVNGDPQARLLPGYRVEKEFGEIRVLRRVAPGPEVRRWRHYAPVIRGEGIESVLRRLHPDAPGMPPDWGIQFADEGGPAAPR